MHLLPERRLGPAEQCSDLAGADAERLGDLDVAEAAVAQREHGGGLRGQPAQGFPEPAAVLERLQDLVGVRAALRGRVEGCARQLPALPALAAPYAVEGGVGGRPVEPGGGVGGVRGVAVVEVQEDLLGDVLRLGAIGDDALRDREHPTVLGDEEPLERVGIVGSAPRFVAGHGLQHSGFHVTQEGTAEGVIVTPGRCERERSGDVADEPGRQEAVRLPAELQDLIASGPMAHLSTINADGTPQVTVIWIGLDGDDVVSGHMGWYAKLRNIDRDPRVVLSFDAPRVPGVLLNPYAVLVARATIESGVGAWDLLNRLAKVYMSPDAEFPAPRRPGYLVRYSVQRIGGVGSWAPGER